MKRPQPYVLLTSYHSEQNAAKFVFEQFPLEDYGLRDPHFSGMINYEANKPFPQLGLREGRVPALHFPERLTDEEAARLPRTVKVHRVPGYRRPLPDRLADFFLEPNPIISAEMRDVILTVSRPEWHQFFPMTFVDAETTSPLFSYTQWYFWGLLAWTPVDEAVDVDAMGGAEKFLTVNDTGRGPKKTLVFPPIPRDTIYLRSVASETGYSRVKSCWRGEFDGCTGFGGIFISREAREAHLRAKLTGMTYVKCNVSRAKL